MELPHQTHVAVVDGENFKLFRNAGSSAEPRLEDCRKIKVEGQNKSAGIAKQDDVGQNLGRTDLDELAHAAAATEWLNTEVLENRIEKLFIIADPKSLGEMRRHYHGKLQDVLVGELDKAVAGEPEDRIIRSIVAA